MSKVAELKKKFETASKVTLTPEQHAAALRQKERDQKEAVRVAKARAARYNLTLRSLELEAMPKDKPIDLSQRPPRLSTINKPSQDKVERSQAILGGALSHERNPKVAIEVLHVVASEVEKSFTSGSQAEAFEEERQKKATADEEERKKNEERKRNEEEAKRKQEEEAKRKKEEEERAALKKKQEEEEIAKKQAAATKESQLKEEAAAAEKKKKEEEAAAEKKRKEEQEEAERQRIEAMKRKEEEEAAAAATAAAMEAEAAQKENAVDDGTTFEMTNLAAALEKGDDDAINKAIVIDFLEEHDPSKLKDVDKMMADNKGKEQLLMSRLSREYRDPIETEIEVTAEVIIKIENEEKLNYSADDEEDDIVEHQRKEAERIKKEEEAKIAAMDDNERKSYMEKLAAQSKHNEDKDKMLKSQLNVYGGGKSAALLGGKGRGRGRGKGKRETEYIVNASNAGGDWSVNTE